MNTSPEMSATDFPVEDDYDRLYREAAPRVWRAVYAYTGGRQEIAEDAVSEAFIRAIEHTGSISHPTAWILRTALRFAGEELRKERRHGGPVDHDLAVPIGGLPEDRVDLIRSLRYLSRNQRVALVLRYTEDLPVAEIARMMGTASPTVRVHLMRGRRRLKQLMDPGGD